MYAVFRAGGKQYRAAEGERLKLEKLDADEGADVSFDEVLLVGEGSDIKVGSPLLSGTSVSAKVLRQGRTGKVTVTKFRRRQNYLRQHTHRQWFTEVEITSIGGAPKKREKEASAAEPSEEAAAPKKTAKKTATKKAAAKKSSKKTATKKTASRKTATKEAAAKDE